MSFFINPSSTVKKGVTYENIEPVDTGYATDFLIGPSNVHGLVDVFCQLGGGGTFSIKFHTGLVSIFLFVRGLVSRCEVRGVF